MTTPTPTPTLPADFTPTAQGCLRSNDFWIWDYELGNEDARTVLGGPSQISDCFPTTWDATVTYAGSACPPQYTSACQGTDSAAAVTCCPNAYNYSCQPTWLPGRHGEQFRCQSQHTSAGQIVVTHSAFKVNTIDIQTRTRSLNQHLFALAMMYTTPASTAESSTLGPTTTEGSSDAQVSSTTLSPGQAAGIGVGAGVAVLLIAAFAAWLLCRRRRARKGAEQPQKQSVVEYADSPPPLTTPSPPGELPSFREPCELNNVDSMRPPKMYELPAR
ncbi:hypothetical protein F5B20DRAFT_269484 [Whalleya microplaca]|nr:hypothetical protein F5B20DRAFT_269484 [Whalleya microplaca]